MTRAWNFSPGPAALPDAVIDRIRDELPDYAGAGMSVMEMSHRGEVFRGIAERAEADLRALMGVPDDYHVLFLHGGATAQFAAVPLNLLAEGAVADYVDTGVWSRKAVAEARRYGEVNVVASSADAGDRGIPPASGWRSSPGAAYLHYTPNETIGGVEFHWTPEPDPGATDVALVADASSNILSRPVDVARFGVIYAGAQKNLGIAGLAIVVVRADLVGRAARGTPAILDWKAQAENGSMLNTSPTFSWYVCGLVLEWLKAEGGVEEMARRNARKAERLYAAIDGSGFYANPVELESRSRMNVPFTLADPALDAPFLEEARAAGLVNLKGHRLVGGMRASLYNAVPERAVEDLIGFMAEFERRHG